MAEMRTDEDRIIESLVIDGKNVVATYDDADFLPVRQSLYNVQTVTPEYDDEISPQIVYVFLSFFCLTSLLSKRYYRISAFDLLFLLPLVLAQHSTLVLTTEYLPCIL